MLNWLRSGRKIVRGGTRLGQFRINRGEYLSFFPESILECRWIRKIQITKAFC